MGIGERVAIIRKKFCEGNNLKFAEFMNENPKTVSNWTSSRNLGTSVAKKILLRFPEIDANWLLLGEGDMYKKKVFNTINNELIQSGNNNNSMGNYGDVSGHNIQISTPENGGQKIIKEGSFEMTYEVLSDEKTQHKIDLLMVENTHLKQTIESLRREIGLYQETLNGKNEIIDSLKSQMNKAK